MIFPLIIGILILGVIIFAHELGHFISAKKLKIGVDEFGLGFPPRIFGIQKKLGRWKIIRGNKESGDDKATIYSLNWIPFGGFVKIKGSAGEEKEEARYAEDDSFEKQKIWKRFIVLSAGVFANLVIAAIFLAIGFMAGLPTVVDDGFDQSRVIDPQVQIVQIQEGSAAEIAGLEVGDVVLKMDENEFVNHEALVAYEEDKAGQEVELTYSRLGQENITKLTLMSQEETGKGIMGAGLVNTGRVAYPWYTSLWLGLKSTVILTGKIIVAFALLIKGLIVGQSGVAESVAGPIGIAVLTKSFTEMGFVYLMQFAALISINLAIFNFLPFPALDGGRVLFLFIEKFRGGKKVSYKVEGIIHTVGFAILVMLLLVVSVRDVFSFSDSISGFINNIF